MTAVVAVDLRPYNEIHMIADTRITYEQDGKIQVLPYGLQKIIPVRSKDKRAIGALGFSGYLDPLKTIVEHLLKEEQITSYRAPFVVNSVVANLHGFIQTGFNKVPSKYKDLSFEMMFAAVDTTRKSISKDTKGNIIENSLVKPIYLSQMYKFKPNRKHKIEVIPSDRTITIIGDGDKVRSTLSPILRSAVGFGRPYDGTPQFRSLYMADIAAEVFHTEGVTSVGGPYWVWEILDPNRTSRCYWQWGYTPDEFPDIEVERSGDDFIISNRFTTVNPFTKQSTEKNRKKNYFPHPKFA